MIVFPRLRARPALAAVAVLTGLLMLTGDRVAARASDHAALGEIFGDESLANVLELCRRTAHLTPAERYPLLLQAVLPEGRDAIRIDIDFAPAHLSEPQASGLGLSSGWTGPLDQFPGRHQGGSLLAPAIDLIQTATQLGRLAELWGIVAERTDRPGVDLKSQLAIQILLEIAGGEYETARDHIDRFHRVVVDSPVLRAERGPEAVVIWSAAAEPQTRSAAYELAFVVYEQARAGMGPRSERWHRQIYAFKHRLEHHSETQQSSSATEDPPADWHPVTRTTAETNGKGFPLSSWDVRPGQVTNVTGHDRNYLYYALPLTGEFTIEADTSTFNYKDIRLGYGGFWAGPGYDFKTILNGHFRSDHATLTLDPPLPEIHEPMRVRIEVRDGQRSTLINGRPVFTAGASPSDPWLSILSYWYTHGWVRNLRISGDPQVPHEIPLATRSDLPGWVPYFDESAGAPGRDWQLVDIRKLRLPTDANARPEMVLLGNRDPQQAGSWKESLLRYHRPFLEDGRILYQFYYEPDRFAADPALGRYAFLLTPSGVQRHLITDGRFERTGLDPGNHEPLEGTISPLPLQEGAWNDVALEVNDDEVRIYLNGQIVAQQPLEQAGQRQFGLFHFADRTEVRVRNLRWQGDWPREVPPSHKQQLADDAVEQLIAGPPLPAIYTHDFSTGVPLDQFLVKGEGWQQNFEQRPNGAHFRREGTGGYQRYELLPQLTLAGDFDVIAEFSDFDAQIAEGGDANIQLLVGVEGAETDCRVYRKFSRFSNKEQGEQLVQAALFDTQQGRRNYAFPKKEIAAESSGRLRLVRRGTRIHYLFAAEDSDNFRLLHSDDVPAGDSRSGQLGLIAETHKAGHAHVTWESITIRAEQITGLATYSSLSIADLNRQRRQLEDHVTLDFGNADDRRRLAMFGDYATFRLKPDGVSLDVPGSDNWRGAGVRARVALQGDFDATLELDVPRLEPTVPGQESCVYLETEFTNDDGRLVQLKYAISHHGSPTAEMTLRSHKPDGEFQYVEVGTLPAASIHQLRIARRGPLAYCIFQQTPQQSPQLLGRLEVGTDPVPLEQLRAIAHTGGTGRQTQVLFRRLDVAADQIIEPVPIEATR